MPLWCHESQTCQAASRGIFIFISAYFQSHSYRLLFSQQLLDPSTPGGSSKPGEGFDVARSGDARVALIGFPSVGKSSLLKYVLSQTH